MAASNIRSVVLTCVLILGLGSLRLYRCSAYISKVNEQYRRHMPRHHAHQQFAASFSHWVIESMEQCEATAFSSAAINRNWQTAVHRDSRNFKGSFGVMTCFRTENYSGGELVFPKYRCAVDYGNRDALLADVHECHGNAPRVGDSDEFTRISCVFYLRDRVVYGGTKKQEAAFIRNHKKGEPFRDVWILNGQPVADNASVPIDERVVIEADDDAEL
jgi:2-oxoglutarate-Fe(II)-dependent dioxygenase family protein